VQKGILNIGLKKTVCCLVFLFSIFSSFSSVYYDRHVFVNVDDETTIDSEQLDYTEFSLTSNGHSSESPENPAESDNSSEIEKEKESETDDDNDEIDEKFVFDVLLIHEVCRQEKTRLVSELNSQGTIVPFYILFHSWKSFLA
jgi:hypothetical protein